MAIIPLTIQLFNSEVKSKAISFRGIKYLFHVLISIDRWGFINNLNMKNNSKRLMKAKASNKIIQIGENVIKKLNHDN